MAMPHPPEAQEPHWPLEELWQAIVPMLPGFTVELLPEVDSTNALLLRRAQAGQTEACLLVALRQTAGRGRLGRTWHSACAGVTASLTFSLMLPLAPRDWSGLSLAVGLSLAQSLHPDIRLKWPNDLWLQGRKLGGILIETVNPGTAAASRSVVVGVGLNIERPTLGGLSTTPAGLCELLPGIDAPSALRRVAGPLVQRLLDFEASGFAPFQAAFNACDALAQAAVVLSDGRNGVALGVDAGGVLLLQTPQGLQRVISADVSLRPQALATQPVA